MNRRQDDDQGQAQLRMRLAQLKLEHDDFHVAIDAMNTKKCDPLSIQRMKKKKLDLKDRIEKMHSQIIPDITA